LAACVGGTGPAVAATFAGASSNLTVPRPQAVAEVTLSS
jgi:hypothetical protein